MNSEPDANLVHQYREFLLLYTDQLNMGWQEPGSDVVKHRRRTRTLGKNRRNQGRPDHLSLDLVRRHLAREMVLHTHPSRGGGKVWFQVDIDAHQGQTDASEVAKFISSLFPSSYHEPSTGGKGIHLYIWVNGFRDMKRYNSILRKCEVLLARLLEHHEFKATIEIKHTFTLMRGDRGSRGSLAKAPQLPHGIRSLQELIAAPAWPLPSLTLKIKESLASAGVSTKVPRILSARRGATHTNAASTTDIFYMLPPIYSSQSEIETNRSLQHRKQLSSKIVRMYSLPQPSDNAFVRMQRAGWHFALTHSRPPEEDELLQHYQHIYAADPADQDRFRRARDVAKFIQRNWNPDKAGYGTYQAPDYLPLAGKISPEHRAMARKKYRYSITDEDLAIGIYCLERASFRIPQERDQQYTFGEGSIRGMFRCLRQAGATNRGCNNHKEIALRLVLCESGFMNYLDTGYVSGYVGQKAGIGPAHPMYAVFQQRLLDMPVITASDICHRWFSHKAVVQAPGSGEETAEGVESRRSQSSAPSKPETATSATNRTIVRVETSLGKMKTYLSRRGYSDLDMPKDEAALRKIYTLLKNIQKEDVRLRATVRSRAIRELAKEIRKQQGPAFLPPREEKVRMAVCIKEARKRLKQRTTTRNP